VWPGAARAQQSNNAVLGFLGSASADGYTATVAAVRQGLNETGYFENRNLAVEYRWADFRYDKLPMLATELVRRPVNVIFATGSVVSALAAKSATATIPIVFANGSDPIQHGLVASLSRPGGNITGITFINSALGPKRIELLREVIPKAAVIAVLVNPKNPNAIDAQGFEAAGRNIGVQMITVNASADQELKGAFDQAVRQRADALLVHVDALFNDHVGQIIGLAAGYALPTMAATTSFTARGGLISYAANVNDLNRQAGLYVGRILKGEKPANLPIVQPTKFELRINLKTAKALGLSISESFLLRADEVIE
jgi:putative ABC transport system substrate-binding protein